jgi:hypothetical protein
MSPRSRKILANCGPIVLGALLTVMGAGKIISALLLGRTALFFTAGLADQPILFFAILAAWTVVLASGLSYVWNGCAELRKTVRGVDATQ